jgi:hypothetical protein
LVTTGKSAKPPDFRLLEQVMGQDLRCVLIDDGDADFGSFTNKIGLSLHSLGALA